LMEHTEHAELPLIPITLDFIAHQLDVQQNGILAEYGITSRQSKILLFILHNQEKPVYQKDIEAFFSMRSSTITSIMGYLEKGGFLMRSPCETDARAKRITVTQKGRDLRRVIAGLLYRQEAQVTRGMSPEETALLRRLLRRVSANLCEGPCGPRR